MLTYLYYGYIAIQIYHYSDYIRTVIGLSQLTYNGVSFVVKKVIGKPILAIEDDWIDIVVEKDYLNTDTKN